ncbi:hypothetical protein XM38_033440 [Halomicronema hongdechloris C2206]|uniref:Uncharacterized protein n=1 Tax=Halomicronema hongdechloris C2206 TaxID=1641165 RepID=A0A1Z3HQI0_9CYAN|nr:hypothetical protein [Halomicronema hongdechloris]ASC72387.1 hypothetical protein XM38_033440 [Halomicronema hongdechloris C2206]
MTHPTNQANQDREDRSLVEFLRQHRPQPPGADPALEQRLMARVSRAETAHHRSSGWQWQWAVPALAASLVLAWSGYRALRPPSTAVSQQEELETFVVEIWLDTTSPGTSSRWEAAPTEWMVALYAADY